MNVTMRWAAVGLAAVMGLSGCASGGEPSVDDPAGSVADGEDVGEADDTPAEEPASGEEGTQEAGSGTATVQVDGKTFTFRVIQCLRDVPGPMGDTVEFLLDGVPSDTASELVEPLLGPVDPDADISERVAPVLEGGPMLSVSRALDGGDVMAVLTALDSAYVSTADVTSVDARFLDISSAVSGATVQGSVEVTTPQGTNAQMSVEAVCP